MTKQRFIISVASLALFAGLFAQQKNITLNAPDNGNKTYVARDYIKLLPGFRFAATVNDKFVGKTQPGMVFEPQEGKTLFPETDRNNFV